ncbi:hypothetical protein SLEP1_g53589 [Rubroshorea leprosula]|uniref:Uncharacterized protein n=1 Tax=Rubroshorea leprosula TaxID=152421 RepID=A0AAV5M9S2_9ROSI|nr:hypothetical protein SLEP1_g53589 [Rubroshorea leprosula]
MQGKVMNPASKEPRNWVLRTQQLGSSRNPDLGSANPETGFFAEPRNWVLRGTQIWVPRTKHRGIQIWVPLTQQRGSVNPTTGCREEPKLGSPTCKEPSS